MNILDRKKVQEMLEGNTINMEKVQDDGLENTTTWKIKRYISYLEEQNTKLQAQVEVLSKVIKTINI